MRDLVRQKLAYFIEVWPLWGILLPALSNNEWDNLVTKGVIIFSFWALRASVVNDRDQILLAFIAISWVLDHIICLVLILVKVYATLNNFGSALIFHNILLSSPNVTVEWNVLVPNLPNNHTIAVYIHLFGQLGKFFCTLQDLWSTPDTCYSVWKKHVAILHEVDCLYVSNTDKNLESPRACLVDGHKNIVWGKVTVLMNWLKTVDRQKDLGQLEWDLILYALADINRLVFQ